MAHDHLGAAAAQRAKPEAKAMHVRAAAHPAKQCVMAVRIRKSADLRILRPSRRHLSMRSAPGSHLLREARALRLLRAKHDDHFRLRPEKQAAAAYVYPYAAPAQRHKLRHAVLDAAGIAARIRAKTDVCRQPFLISDDAAARMPQEHAASRLAEKLLQQAGLVHRIAHLSHACGQTAHERMVTFLHQHH